MEKLNEHKSISTISKEAHGGEPRLLHQERLGNFEPVYIPAPFYNRSKDRMLPTRSQNMQAWNRVRKDYMLNRG